MFFTLFISVATMLCILHLATPSPPGTKSKYKVTNVAFNPDSAFSGRIERFLNGDFSPPRGTYSQEKSYPAAAYKPNCSIELVLQTWTNINSQLPAFGSLQIEIPMLESSKSWQCYYRSAWLNNDDNIPLATALLPKERFLTTLVYCPSLYESSAKSVGSIEKTISSGMCPLLNTLIEKGATASIKLALRLLNLPPELLHGATVQSAIDIGPLYLRAVTKRNHGLGLSTRYITSTLDKPQAKLVDVASDSKLALKNTVSLSGSSLLNTNDKCKSEWADLEIVGRCFGLKTHTEYPALKHISLVEDASHCKALCCELGLQCITWQYWIDIKMCKLGDAVRIGKEHADSHYWCDDAPPITWTGEKFKRLPSGKSNCMISF